MSSTGKTRESLRSNILMKIDILGISNSECSNIYKSKEIIDNQICAGGNSTGNFRDRSVQPFAFLKTGSMF